MRRRSTLRSGARCCVCWKPGAHLVAFSGTRTYHRMACAIEDAGFEIRDQLAWVYGKGFPKSHNVSKAIDKAAGLDPIVVSERVNRSTFDPDAQGEEAMRAARSAKRAPHRLLPKPGRAGALRSSHHTNH